MPAVAASTSFSFALKFGIAVSGQNMSMERRVADNGLGLQFRLAVPVFLCRFFVEGLLSRPIGFAQCDVRHSKTQ